MGVGRRMKKQGPPPPLDEARLAVLKKRKAAESDGADVRGKKRRTSSELGKSTTAVNGASGVKKVKNSGLKESTKGKFVNGKTDSLKGAANLAKSKQKKKGPLPASNINDDDSDGLDGEPDSEDDAEIALQDDFLASGSSVYDSDVEGRRAMFSEDEDDSDAEEQLTAANIEGLSRRLDERMEDDAAQAQAELQDSALQTNIAGDRPRILGDADDSDEDDQIPTNLALAPDLQLLRVRITDTIRVLDDFSALAEAGRSRADYVAQLLKDICAYYGYSPFLAEKLFNLFPPREAFAFFEANETARPVVVRTNTLRTNRRGLAQALINRGVTLEPVGKWSKVGLQVFESQVPLGATPEYLAGHYILQAASSFLPVMALAPQEHERILDMAAAPGGKTTYISALMKNTGVVFANDSNKSRAKGLIGNIHRLGAKNTIVCSHDAREFPKVMGGFDRVLLDAPCSGTGVIAKDPSVKTNKTSRDFLALPHLQKQLLLCAIDSVDHASKTGSYIVYSTCSVAIEENEQVVQYALRKRPNVRLVDTGLPFGVDGFTRYMGKTFDDRLKTTKRYYPHAHNVDGFFVAKFRKTGPTPANALKPSSSSATTTTTTDLADHAPISTAPEDDADSANGDPFGGWNSDEDRAYIERARKARLRRKGVDPKSLPRKDGAGVTVVEGMKDMSMGIEREGELGGEARGKKEKKKVEKNEKSAKGAKAERRAKR
ncbi:MAG: rRNA (cytosine-C5-)-methyltransferase nop2 [Caeruleum heppii]|nr:MAG: rRNA (cytosine-C5-)-methyltransferase nop2 [Caeruleum heppii]